ncbi:MFS general substrate transporter [Epithele typhae]|uniref:MFS general substrate transporter n=1 Tax=Epithele typhae TaxID=378194 RepID=UPI002007F408|nr:MFS general substrate transporter [Epithele typhae]KAH9918249.1 MFS general substrate transporter [Epithele typhae]
MTFPSNPDADPDPSSQIAWPARHGKPSRNGSGTQAQRVGVEERTTRSNGKPVASGTAVETDSAGGKKRMSTLDLIYLSLAMGGSQVAWTVELGYGTPFLLELGLTEQLTSLVWLAGPISGLVAQPVIGAISDASTSKYRRRFWIVTSTAVLVISTLTIAYCREIASFFVNDVFGGGGGSWDPENKQRVHDTAIGFAIVSFYLLDFALNALQASLRNLLLDVTPPGQLNAANAWHSKMLNAGNIVGYGLGFLPLANLPILRLLGGSQFRKFCVVCMIILSATVWVTCWTQQEPIRKKRQIEKRSSMRDIVKNIWNTVWSLPLPIQRVCIVQLFAFMGWFPFLFYSTTYVCQILAYELGEEPDHDRASRTGALAMLIYSFVAVAAGSLLPYLTRRDAALLAHAGDEDEDAELRRLRAKCANGAPRPPRTASRSAAVYAVLPAQHLDGRMILFTGLTLATFFVTRVWQAVVLVSLVGICWAVACWAPFAIIMERGRGRRRTRREAARRWSRRPSHGRTLSTPGERRGSRTVNAEVAQGERAPLLRRRRSFGEHDAEEAVVTEAAGGGTVLGIHNLAIVMPQFVVAIASSLIFRAVDGEAESGPHGGGGTFYGKNGVAWVLRFGGICTLFGAMLAQRVPPTRTEKEMRRRLAELKVLQEESTV